MNSSEWEVLRQREKQHRYLTRISFGLMIPISLLASALLLSGDILAGALLAGFAIFCAILAFGEYQLVIISEIDEDL